MAYNNLSGTVFMPTEFLTRPDVLVSTVLSGNLSTSDAADVINVPRVSNATNNAIVTNVGGDANNLICESNLTFDGEILRVTGDLSASINISASAFYGDGSNLVNVKADHVVAEGPVHALQYHDSVDGDITGSANLIFSSNSLMLTGTLNVSGSIIGTGMSHSRVAVSSDYTVTTSDYYIGVNTTNSAVKVTLPEATNILDGQTFIVKDEGGVANVNHITISGSASDTIDGQNTVILESPFASIQLYCNGTNKFFIC